MCLVFFQIEFFYLKKVLQPPKDNKYMGCSNINVTVKKILYNIFFSIEKKNMGAFLWTTTFFRPLFLGINTQYMRKSTIIYPVKMECGWFLWLKASVYVHIPQKILFEIPPCAKPFSDPVIYFIKESILDQNEKFSNKNDIVSACRDFKNIFCGIWTLGLTQ